MEKTNYWSGMKPAVEDLQFDQEAKENAIKDRFTTAFRNGVVPGEGDELEVYVPDPDDHTKVRVKIGKAYIDGEKVEVTAEQEVTLDNVDNEDNIIWIRYKTVEGDYRNHYITGTPYPCRIYDSYELGATRESLFDPTGKLQLARASVEEKTGLYVIDLRESLQLKSALLKNVFADETIPTTPSNVQVTTGMVRDLSSVQEGAYGKEKCWIRASWDASTDPVGIAVYRVVWIPKNQDDEDEEENRIEKEVRMTMSPEPRTDCIFYDVPPGQRGYVKVKAVDRAGNESDWASSSIIIAGYGSTPDAPSIELSSAIYGALLTITQVSNAEGYEVYVREGAWPEMGNPAYLLGAGPQLTWQIPADVGVEVYVRVRSYGAGGLYSTSYAEAHVRSGRMILARTRSFEAIVRAWENYT